MRSLLIGLFLAVSAIGCANPQIGGTIQRNAARNDRFCKRMEDGATTREQEQAFIRANRRGWHAVDLYYNDIPLPPDIQAWFEEHAGEDE